MRRARRYCNARTTRMPAWVHNRFRDLDERWKSASTGRRTACPTYFAKRLIQQGGAGGFACRSHGLNQWPASKLNIFPKTVMHAGMMGRNDGDQIKHVDGIGNLFKFFLLTSPPIQ